MMEDETHVEPTDHEVPTAETVPSNPEPVEAVAPAVEATSDHTVAEGVTLAAYRNGRLFTATVPAELIKTNTLALEVANCYAESEPGVYHYELGGFDVTVTKE